MLSNRLKEVATMVTENSIVADIGTDHGYVPIYLVENHIAKKVYAMDINEGPLKIANKNISQRGLADCIETILSDGMEKMKDNMADTVVIAGMGGDLIVNILKNGENISGITELVLSPHKRVDLVRKYLLENNWQIVKEKFLMDAGKYYTIIKAVKDGKKEDYSEAQLVYGKYLLEQKDKTLKEYLKKEKNKFENILRNMEENDSAHIDKIKAKLKLNMEGREYYD